MKTLKIEIKQQTELSGVVYYKLYFDGKFETLDSDFNKIKELALKAEEVFNSGDTEPKVVYSKELSHE